MYSMRMLSSKKEVRVSVVDGRVYIGSAKEPKSNLDSVYIKSWKHHVYL